MNQFELEREIAHIKAESHYSLKTLEQMKMEIAARALQGILANELKLSPQYAARNAVEYANALVQALREDDTQLS